MPLLIELTDNKLVAKLGTWSTEEILNYWLQLMDPFPRMGERVSSAILTLSLLEHGI